MNSTAGTDHATASQRVVSTSASEINASTAPSIEASNTDTWPLVMGRALVRFTCLSKSRSAMSLMQQPALRISTVPSTKTISRCQPGKPSAATHSATSVGQTSTSQPAGRLKRTRSRYRDRRERGATADMRAMVFKRGKDRAARCLWRLRGPTFIRHALRLQASERRSPHCSLRLQGKRGRQKLKRR